MKKRTIGIDISDLGGLSGTLKHIIEDIVSDLGETKKGKIPVGMISHNLLNEFLSWREAKEDLEMEIELQTKLAQKRMERELSERFEQRYNAMQQRKKGFWDKVHKELDLSEDSDLNIDPKTGVISQWVEVHGKSH